MYFHNQRPPIPAIREASTTNTSRHSKKAIGLSCTSTEASGDRSRRRLQYMERSLPRYGPHLPDHTPHVHVASSAAMLLLGDTLGGAATVAWARWRSNCQRCPVRRMVTWRAYLNLNLEAWASSATGSFDFPPAPLLAEYSIDSFRSGLCGKAKPPISKSRVKTGLRIKAKECTPDVESLRGS